jgi:hypothetical protein
MIHKLFAAKVLNEEEAVVKGGKVCFQECSLKSAAADRMSETSSWFKQTSEKKTPWIRYN